MRIYLDVCCLQRPLDDRSQPRVNVEAEAVLTILRLVESGRLVLLSSEAIDFEIDNIPNPDRQAQTHEMLKLAKQTLLLSEEVEKAAHGLIEEDGLRPLDALHVAFASVNRVQYFCTCDDKLLKKANRIGMQGTQIVSPLELIAKVTS